MTDPLTQAEAPGVKTSVTTSVFQAGFPFLIAAGASILVDYRLAFILVDYRLAFILRP
jgi:hypothetical protein